MQLYAVEALRTYGVVATLSCWSCRLAQELGLPASENLMNIASQWAPAGIMAVGMTFVILTGGFDLSVARSLALAVIAAASDAPTHRSSPSPRRSGSALAIGSSTASWSRCSR